MLLIRQGRVHEKFGDLVRRCFLEDFVFATYVLTLKKALKKDKANEKVISHLYGLISIPVGLDGKGDRTIDCPKTTGNDIINRRANPHQQIQAHSHDPEVLNTVAASFEKRFGSNIHWGKLPLVIDELNELISNSSMPKETKAELSRLASLEKPWEFLSHVFLASLLPENKRAAKLETTLDPHYPNRPDTNIPPVASHSEGQFVGALMDVYAELEECEGFDLEILDEYPKSKKHFQRQRANFYAAEAVRRGTRDVFSSSEENQFEVLEDEIFEGVDELYYSPYKNGMERLTKVLSQASCIPIQRSWLGRDTDWISAAEKKGVCHFLVNDGRLQGWVDVDE